jgi:hypothetical protein
VSFFLPTAHAPLELKIILVSLYSYSNVLNFCDAWNTLNNLSLTVVIFKAGEIGIPSAGNYFQAGTTTLAYFFLQSTFTRLPDNYRSTGVT